MAGSVKSFFNSTETPRWWLMLGGALVIAAAFGQSLYFFHAQQKIDAAQEAEHRIETKLQEIQGQSIDFQTYAGAFVSAVLDKSQDVDEHRKRLIDNLIAQDTAIDVSSRLFDKQTAEAANRYRTALREAKSATENANDVLSLSQFWAAASDLLVARNALLDDLARQMQPLG